MPAKIHLMDRTVYTYDGTVTELTQRISSARGVLIPLRVRESESLISVNPAAIARIESAEEDDRPHFEVIGG